MNNVTRRTEMLLLWEEGREAVIGKKKVAGRKRFR